MTEQNTQSIPIEGTTTVKEKVPKKEQQSITREKRSGSLNLLLLGTVIIVLVSTLSTGLYFYQQQQFQQQHVTNQSLRQELTQLKQSQAEDRKQLELLLQQHSKALETSNRQQDSLTRQLNELQEKIASISSSDAKIWLLAQADFLVKMAGRKLWGDQDITSAAILLKSADASLVDMNDPSLIEVRRAITEDINTVSIINQIDFDGIILKLNQLANQVDSLRLADNSTDNPPMDEDNNALSGSLSQWRQNLNKSWQNFITDFISIRRRDSNAEPLLAPNQDVYLRENIRARLLIAAQAVSRHQDEVYRQSLETSSTWIRAYFDANDINSKTFLAELDNLSQQSISTNLPDHLRSPSILENLMQTRVRNLLAQTPMHSQEH
ncbi:uroporphyrinogen-III C-methyltransferase [Candidatus Fukatsuia symbiotica]|uniref:uroporphyrinogen-III C-methyltransferase n=1 Tax=Candidatus Fukatsuia TaxID=1927833 RepID=UPI0009339351|nr:uroporphyrinogen-III C-methyltransferase [Candidatus Fukatsuia symbiotica]MEA9444906.1 uroporphyrinogen-III C-methyltransferase [Candidatus Fukatsuia symbiotica]